MAGESDEECEFGVSTRSVHKNSSSATREVETPDTSAPMDIGQVKGTKGKGKKERERQGERQEQDNGETKGNAWTDDSYLAGKCGYCGKWRHKKAQCRKQKDQKSKPPATTVQAVATVNQVQSSPPDED